MLLRALLICVVFYMPAAMAELAGFHNGRTATLGQLPDLSVELGLSTGDYYEADYQNIGFRINFKLSEEILLIGDVSQLEIGIFDETAFGIGAFYALSGVAENYDTAAKASFHKSEDANIIAVEFLVSGQEPISDNGLMWYVNLGIHRVKDDGFSETDFGFGGGVVLPTSSGEAYFGIDNIDEFTFGFGYRHFL